MCHQLLCCFGPKEPDNRPPSHRLDVEPPSSDPTKVSNSSVNGGSSNYVSSDSTNRSPVPSSSHPKVSSTKNGGAPSNSPHKDSSAINGGARSPVLQQSNAPVSQGVGEPQEVISQDQNTEQSLNGKIQDKPSPYSTQGKVNPKEPNEQVTRTEKPADLSEEQPLAPKVPPKNSGTRDETADQDKVSHKVLTPKKEFVQDEEASRNPLHPKQQVHPPKGSSTNQESTDDQKKVSTKIVAPKRNKEYDPSEDESRKHADK
ncbi:hypothetical protein J5N97_007555 [Dioscorea zingiberensis]|uniref:Uncharacterized protein n=1 Tax=Dioscorea zingiberensis TaxID=325984 RepID=A0A9D5DDE4_9LILI|nr:hypothetical protein J5N97_007555 [Dioscorea zingiberensis]